MRDAPERALFRIGVEAGGLATGGANTAIAANRAATASSRISDGSGAWHLSSYAKAAVSNARLGWSRLLGYIAIAFAPGYRKPVPP
jgi:hypothetical protein